MAIPPSSMGVDPTAIPKKMTRQQLEWWILFSIMVAGKGAKQTEAKLNALLADVEVPKGWNNYGPFFLILYITSNRDLMAHLRKHKTGKYNLTVKGFYDALELDLNNLTVDSLEQVHGIGPKSARMILLYAGLAEDLVPLDTHVLKFLRKRGYDAPKSTPPAGKRYLELEQAFIAEARREGKTVRELDTEVWLSYAKV